MTPALESAFASGRLVQPDPHQPDLVHLVRAIAQLTGVSGFEPMAPVSYLADLIGMPKRGYVRPGCFADLVVLDWTRLGRGPVRRVRDLPGGDDRLLTDRPTGIVHVLVNGAPIRRDEAMVTDLDRLPGGPLLATTAQ